MSKLYKRLSTIILISTLILSGCSINNSSETSQPKDKIKVVATIFPIYDILKNVGGEKVDAITLIPAGSSPHTYDPSPQDVIKVSDTDLAFVIGHGLDNWAANIIPNDVQVITVDSNISLLTSEHSHEDDHHESEEEHEEEGTNPHYWLSVSNAKVISETIKDNLCRIDQDNCIYYSDNYDQYLTELNSLETEITNLFDSEEYNKTIITFHDAFGYLAEETGLNVITTIEPFPGKEPTPQYLSEIFDVIKEYNINVLYSEPQLSNNTLNLFVDENNVKLITLDPLGGTLENDSYIKLIRYNINQIKEGQRI